MSKILITYPLSEEENNQIRLIAPIHDIDLAYYKQEITIDDLIKHLKENKEVQNKILIIDFPDGIIYNLLGFLRELSTYNKSNTDKLLREIAKVDYETSKYILENIGNNFEISKRMKFYECMDELKIITTMYQNQDFLFEACDIFICRTIYQEFRGISLKAVPSSEESPVIKKLTKK